MGWRGINYILNKSGRILKRSDGAIGSLYPRIHTIPSLLPDLYYYIKILFFIINGHSLRSLPLG